MSKLCEWLSTVGLLLLLLATVAVASSITTFTLIEQYQHNYKTCVSNYSRVKITIGGESSDYYIKELYEDSKTYKIIDGDDRYHIVYKEDCEFYGKE
jgi:hypothetical protein